MILHLADLLVIQSIRFWILKNPLKSKNWLRGLQDPLIARTLALLHRDYHIPWTIEKVAQTLGTSRSLLAQRFNDLAGTGVIEYLTEWRMTKALQLMERRDHSLEAISEKVGYSSLAAFSKAFKRIHGTSPGKVFK